MNELVVVRNDVLVTDSRTVAEYFGKKHKNVIRDVENIIDDLKAIDVEETAPLCDGLKNEPVKEMFFVDTYIDAKGESRKMYWLTEDGFTLLAMGFTGVSAEGIVNDLGLQLTPRTAIIPDPPRHIYAVGDCANGASLVVRAMADAKRVVGKIK